MKNKNLQFSLYLLICFLGFCPTILFASNETKELPNLCQKKYVNYSERKKEKLIFKTEKAVSNLPELKKLASKIQANEKIVYSSTLVEEKVSNQLGCFSEVIVYISDSKELHLWHMFLVDVTITSKLFIMNNDGEYVTLSKWRKGFN